MKGEELPTGSSSIENFTPLKGYLLCLVGENLPKPSACPHICLWGEKVHFIRGFGLVTPHPFSLHELGGAGPSPPHHIPVRAGNEARGEGYFPMLINSPFTRYSGVL